VGSRFVDFVLYRLLLIAFNQLAQGAQDDGGGIAIAWETVRLLKELNLVPRRTIRCVMWTDEETGGSGAQTYFRNHNASLGLHIAAIESDGGVYKPTGFSFTGGAIGLQYLQDNIVDPYLIPLLNVSIWAGGGAADIGPLINAGGAASNLLPPANGS